jgi:hypothetical protein
MFDLYVSRWNSGHSPNIGLYNYRTSYILVDPQRMATEEQLSSVFMHETGHWLGMSHVCTGMETLRRTDCSPVGHGTSVMNPFTDPGLMPRFSDLDAAEFRRINR